MNITNQTPKYQLSMQQIYLLNTNVINFNSNYLLLLLTTKSTMELQDAHFQQYFSDYKHIAQGLKKLEITAPLDLQEQLLDIEKPIENLILSAPAESGKTLGVILLALKKFYNQQQGILVFVCHSKQLSQNINHTVSTLTKIDILNLFMRKIDHLQKKAILIGSPLQLNSVSKLYKDQITEVVIVQSDILFSFGYTDSMKLLSESLPKGVSYKMTCVQKTQQINNFKDAYLPKAVKIDYLPPKATQQIVKIQKSEDQLTHFYQVGQKIFVPISLYVSLKFNLVNPKILILCQNLKEVYRYYLLLQRGKLNGIGLYNHENPINLKFYTLSLWMNGNVNVLISTKHILDDLSGNLFKQNCKKSYKKNHFQLLNMTTIITCNIAFLQNEFQHILDIFHSKPFVMTFIQNKQSEITALHKFIEYQNSSFANVKRKELPITKKQLQAFRYRVNDVWMSLGNTRIQQFQKLDFKKKMLRSSDLKQYFEDNKKERDVLVRQINALRKKIDSDCMKISEFIPDYLVPECLKASYDQKVKKLQKAKQEQKGPQYIQKVRRVLKHIDMEEQNPQTTDVSRLKLISNRKRWKLQHGFKLKKRNMKNEKKGIFQST